ncbi:hypothetical protein CLAFUW4_10693 [Fulvia fulva]|uniref:Uncharacterized protein n=1 Tax=Passalora fulva TaxID=5499 RepID=A0A9Q8LFZ6_PASFU|nr:uncharacterized protein CLAFUR5_05307 [Fulvia fulva]KAK4615763.1 hypothetical protein CLAFUR4_10698 [Fulvia fulva]KAK4617137.1 hypothetical protein CLAFUR0_10704 [Fulvia fulva]UJO16729.1 hypothetical protein CLAFUR5_05307 [Fulvia fulva]WPV19090.1 hypothetical protein CLAFUW4_10693 [Fulvia fulva]WPV34385.1 hypothetical protein CLAFUW7_10695 [Fulvia fulva]
MPHLWSLQERHLIHIAFSEYNLPPEHVASVFAHAFSTGHWPDGLPSDLRLRDEYNSRYQTGRSKQWREHVERNNYTAAQEQDRQQARGRIQVAAQALNITLTGTAPAPTTALAQATPVTSAPVQSTPAPAGPANTPAANGQPATATATTAPAGNTLKRKRPISEPYKHHTIFTNGVGGEAKKAETTTPTARATRAAARMTAEHERLGADRGNDAAQGGELAINDDGEAIQPDNPIAQNNTDASDDEAATDDQIPLEFDGRSNAAILKAKMRRHAKLPIAPAGTGIPTAQPTPVDAAPTMLADANSSREATPQDQDPDANSSRESTPQDQDAEGPAHDGPTFEQIHEHQRLANPLHPANPQSENIRRNATAAAARAAQRTAPIWIAMIATPEQREHAIRVIEAEIERRRLEGEEDDAELNEDVGDEEEDVRTEGEEGEEGGEGEET